MAESLRWAVSRLASRLRSQQSGDGRTLTRVGASILANLRHSGSLTVSALAAIEGLQPQSLTRVLNALEGDGCISRRQDEQDRRAQRISITDRGRVALHDHVEEGNRWLADALEVELTPAEREILQVAARLMLQVAEHGGQDKAMVGAPAPL